MNKVNIGDLMRSSGGGYAIKLDDKNGLHWGQWYVEFSEAITNNNDRVPFHCPNPNLIVPKEML